MLSRSYGHPDRCYFLHVILREDPATNDHTYAAAVNATQSSRDKVKKRVRLFLPRGSSAEIHNVYIICAPCRLFYRTQSMSLLLFLFIFRFQFFSCVIKHQLYFDLRICTIISVPTTLKQFFNRQLLRHRSVQGIFNFTIILRIHLSMFSINYIL